MWVATICKKIKPKNGNFVVATTWYDGWCFVVGKYDEESDSIQTIDNHGVHESVSLSSMEYWQELQIPEYKNVYHE